MTTLTEIIDIINQAKTIAIMGHKYPDGDSFGSLFALGTYLENIGKKVTYYCDNRDIKPYFQFIFPVKKLKYAKFKPSKFDLLIAVDSSSPNRLGIHEESFTKHKNTLVIDHHIQQEQWSKYIYFDEKKASNCENIYKLLSVAKAEITPEIATYLYLGVSSDTGSFKHYNTNQNCFDVASKLLKFGADIHKVNDYLYRYYTLSQIQTEKFILNNLVLNNNFAYVIITMKDLESIGANKGDVSMHSDKLISFAGIGLGIIATETKPNYFDLSMRSSEKINVNEIAVKNGGGGHKRAAGCNFEGTKEDLIKFINQLFMEIKL